jgi:hypothetical protein
MAKVGQWVTDSKSGAYCKLTFKNGEKIYINHDKGGFKGGWLTIDRVRGTFFSFDMDRVFTCDLDSREGKHALSCLTRDVETRSLDGTPLGAFVKYLKSSGSVHEVIARCRALMAISRSSIP